MAATVSEVQEVYDVYGRRYRTGESPEELTGHGRRSLRWAAWACMVAISPLQYGFAILVPGLAASAGWRPTQAFWLLALFVVFQAGVAVPAARMHRASVASPVLLVTLGGVFASVGLLTLAHVGSFAGAVAGYSLAGGAGAGLIYSTCVTTSARWFPDDRVSTIGFVTGGFACGAVPVIVLVTVLGPAAQWVVLTCAAGLALPTVVVLGRRLQDPPPHWWPDHLDAQTWAVDHKLNRSIPCNIPAVRQYTCGEALRTGVLPAIWLLLASITTVSLFGLAFVVGYAQQAGLGLAVAGTAAGVLAAVSGFVRAAAGHLSDRFGRLRVLGWVLALEGAAQVALVVAGQVSGVLLYVCSAVLIGIGGGAFYAIFAEVVLEFFGEQSLVHNQAAVYSAKAAGGLVGVGGAALLIDAVGYVPSFLAAAGLAFVAACAVRLVRQPGRPTLPVYSGVHDTA